MTRRLPALLVLLAGALQVFAYAPFYLFPLAILSPALLFYFWQAASPLRAAWLGWCYGMGLFGAGASWVYVSIHEFGNMPAPLAASMVVLFVAYLALFPALAGWVAARLFPAGSVRLLLAVPALWVISEWLRGWLLSGFPCHWLPGWVSMASAWSLHCCRYCWCWSSPAMPASACWLSLR